MTTSEPEALSAEPGELDMVALIRAARLRHQRIHRVAEYLADPTSRTSLPDMAGQMITVLHQHARDLRAAAEQTRWQGRQQLARLRAAEADARGVALDEIDDSIPEPEPEQEQEDGMSTETPAEVGPVTSSGVPVDLSTSGWVAAGVGSRITHRPDEHGAPVPVDEDATTLEQEQGGQ